MFDSIGARHSKYSITGCCHLKKLTLQTLKAIIVPHRIIFSQVYCKCGMNSPWYEWSRYGTNGLQYKVINVEESSQIVVIYTGFAKAFDKVPHQKLIWHQLILWITEFAQQRNVRVKIDQTQNSILPEVSYRYLKTVFWAC